MLKISLEAAPTVSHSCPHTAAILLSAPTHRNAIEYTRMSHAEHIRTDALTARSAAPACVPKDTHTLEKGTGPSTQASYNGFWPLESPGLLYNGL